MKTQKIKPNTFEWLNATIEGLLNDFENGESTIEETKNGFYETIFDKLVKEIQDLRDNKSIPMQLPVSEDFGVKVSYILDLQKRRAEINKIPFDKLRLLDDNNNEIPVEQSIKDEWKFIGLNNTDYVNTYYYKQGFVDESQNSI